MIDALRFTTGYTAAHVLRFIGVESYFAEKSACFFTVTAYSQGHIQIVCQEGNLFSLVQIQHPMVSLLCIFILLSDTKLE